MDEQNLQQKIESEIGRRTISKIEIPEYITSNIKYDIWYWQQEALQYFLAFDDPEFEYEKPANEPTHLLFNLATGTGKTLLMASLILYYYKKGYRNFIFFVNQNNIVDKTENNFINKSHTKYLFRQNIVIDDKTVNIRKVETFDNSDDIQIKFTSIHKLHNAVYLAKENSVTLEDLTNRDLVMFGDEAHHLNAATMRNGQMDLLPQELTDRTSESVIEKSWEDTVINRILKRGSDEITNNRNALLEFTATVPSHADVIEKYRTKTIYKFELVDFLNAGYTKEINLISTSLPKKEKMLLALLFNWYRHEIALKNDIPNFKPVILFRSKFIEDSKNDFSEFKTIINDLSVNDFDFIKTIEGSIKEDSNKSYEQGNSRIKQMLSYISDNDVRISDIVSFLKDEFSERNCIITNSKDNTATTKEKTSEEQEELLNSLEDKNNHIRAIFTVKRLTEGWDVLNLFDIVRLYEGRDEGARGGQRVAGQATVQETQLIGRGVRYYPFEYKDLEKRKRKFDSDLENPLRVLEEFYYHSEDDVRYLDELKRELKNKGLIQDNRTVKKFALKDEFKETTFFKKIKIWKNERIDNPEKRKLTLDEIKEDFVFQYKTQEIAVREQRVILDSDEDETLTGSTTGGYKTLSITLSDFERHVVNKAIHIKSTKDLSMLRFDNLKEELNINSIDDLFDNKLIGDIRVNIVVSKDINSLDEISNQEQLNLLLELLDSLVVKLKEVSNPYKGSDKFKSFSFEEIFGEEKEKNIVSDPESESLEKELLQQHWYILNGFNGTSEERELIEFVMNKIGNLKEKYKEVYLLRNEEVYKIFDFNKGRGFEPDYLLFLKGQKENLYYQIFIEPKGSQFQDRSGGFTEGREGWKEEFLLQITGKYGNGELLKFEDNNYKLIGLPLFNKNEEASFDSEFTKHVLN